MKHTMHDKLKKINNIVKSISDFASKYDEFETDIDEIITFLQNKCGEMNTIDTEVDEIREKYHKIANEEVANKMKKRHNKKNN